MSQINIKVFILVYLLFIETFALSICLCNILVSYDPAYHVHPASSSLLLLLLLLSSFLSLVLSNLLQCKY